jgi:putative effector of murein hydrolase
MEKLVFSYFIRDHPFAKEDNLLFIYYLSSNLANIIYGISNRRLMSPHFMCAKLIKVIALLLKCRYQKYVAHNKIIQWI